MATTPLWPLVLYFAGVLGLVAAMVGVSYFLGERHSESATGEPFESGVVTVGYGRFRFSAQFYLVAILFVIFDLEVVFIIAWAVAFRELGWAGYAGAMVFLAILVVGLIYEWGVGALEWGPQRSRRGAQARQAEAERASQAAQV